MLTIFGPESSGYCDRINRRGFLRIGTFAMGGAALNLADIYRAEGATKARTGKTGGLGHKAVINIFLAGGAPHQDTFDLKPDAPSEIRGEFKPIATNVNGIEICEVFPKLARLMDKSAIIRSIVGATGRHDLYQCNSGWSESDLRVVGGRPSLGSIVARLQGSVDPAVLGDVEQPVRSHDGRVGSAPCVGEALDATPLAEDGHLAAVHLNEGDASVGKHRWSLGPSKAGRQSSHAHRSQFFRQAIRTGAGRAGFQPKKGLR